jgi:DNA polymerase-3 subunit beta
MAAALKSVAYAQSAEETQFNLMGVHIDARDGRLTFAATNRHILASVSRSAPDGSGGLETGITVPRKLVGELIRMLEASEGEIDLVTDCELIRFTLGDSEVIGKLIDGEYPDWRRAVPSDHPETLKVRTASLAAAVRRAVLVAEDKTRSVRADFRNDIVLVSSRGALSGSAEEEVPCTYPGGEFAVGLNSRYVLDTLDALGAEEIECALQPQGVGGSAASILFTSPARPDGQWVIMPMRV